METVEVVFDGVPLVVPLIGGYEPEFPYDTLETFGSYCGAGKGIGDHLVPEHIFGVCVSAACWVHDIMWEIADDTWADFHHSNSVFLHNLLSIINHRGNEDSHKYARYHRAVTYYHAVDSGLGKFFWSRKNDKRNHKPTEG